MKRWLVILLVLLALIILVSPGIVGRLAENNIAQNIEWAEGDSPGVTIKTESFERGWFTSEGRHRVVIEGGRFRDVTEKYTEATGNPELPSLIIDTHLDHGPLPISSMAPGLASTVSTFQVDPGNGVPIEIPGKLTSQVGLTGSTDSYLLLEAGSFEHEDTSFEWQGVDMTVATNPGSGAISVDGEIKPWKITGEGTVADFGAITITANQVKSDFGFSVGSVEMEMGPITIDDNASVISIAGLSLSADSAIDDARLNAHTVFGMQTMTIPAVGEVDFTVDLSLEGMDAASIRVIGKALQDAQGEPDPEAALAALYPEIEDELQALFRKGFSVKVEPFDVSLPQGVLATRLEVDVPESNDSADFNWANVLLGMTASLDLRVPGAIYEMAAMMNAQAGSLVAMGILKPDGEDYVLEAEYAQGLINVNGAPMPIPIPGM